MSNLEPESGFFFESGKVYTHAQGLSCCFRQWRAKDSHCRFLHGYAIKVVITFRRASYRGALDSRNWVQDFGGLKPLKAWLEETFDHKTLVAKDDPEIDAIRAISQYGHSDRNIIQLVEVDHVGCEAFAKMIFEHANKLVDNDVLVQSVEVWEHDANFARYERNK